MGKQGRRHRAVSAWQPGAASYHQPRQLANRGSQGLSKHPELGQPGGPPHVGAAELHHIGDEEHGSGQQQEDGSLAEDYEALGTLGHKPEEPIPGHEEEAGLAEAAGDPFGQLRNQLNELAEHIQRLYRQSYEDGVPKNIPQQSPPRPQVRGKKAAWADHIDPVTQMVADQGHRPEALEEKKVGKHDVVQEVPMHSKASRCRRSSTRGEAVQAASPAADAGAATPATAAATAQATPQGELQAGEAKSAGGMPCSGDIAAEQQPPSGAIVSARQLAEEAATAVRRSGKGKGKSKGKARGKNTWLPYGPCMDAFAGLLNCAGPDRGQAQSPSMGVAVQWLADSGLCQATAYIGAW